MFTNAEMGFSYRHSEAPDDVIFTRASLQGRPGDRAAINAEMERITAAREASQPIREKTGGSTFKNPPGAQGLAADRRRRLSRARRRRRRGLDDALQFPHQPRRARPPPTSRRSAKRCAGACARRAASSWSGRSSGWAWRGRGRSDIVLNNEIRELLRGPHSLLVAGWRVSTIDARARMVALFLWAAVTQAIAAEAGAKRINLSDYQSFVKNWSSKETPLCAAMDFRADWDAVMHPAPTMGQIRPFSPPEAFWKRNSSLVLARVINSGGDDLDVFKSTA